MCLIWKSVRITDTLILKWEAPKPQLYQNPRRTNWEAYTAELRICLNRMSFNIKDSARDQTGIYPSGMHDTTNRKNL